MRWIRDPNTDSPGEDLQVRYLRKRVRPQPTLSDFHVEMPKKRKYTRRSLESNKENAQEVVPQASPGPSRDPKKDPQDISRKVTPSSTSTSSSRRNVLGKQPNPQESRATSSHGGNAPLHHYNTRLSVRKLQAPSSTSSGLRKPEPQRRESLANMEEQLYQEFGHLDPKEIICLLLNLMESQETKKNAEINAPFLQSDAQDLFQESYFGNGWQNHWEIHQDWHGTGTTLTLKNYARNERVGAMGVHPMKFFQDKLNQVNSYQNNSSTPSCTVVSDPKIRSIEQDIKEICSLQYHSLNDSEYEIYSGVIDQIMKMCN